MANITYKSYEIPTDHEHLPSLTGANCGHKINLSGATTIKLTHRPPNVQVWISTESNGTNLYPLINRGDGWVNLPEPLYDLYVFTKGTTPDGEKVLLNYTGQNDFFAYGSNASEMVESIGGIKKIYDISEVLQFKLSQSINDSFSALTTAQTIFRLKFSLGRTPTLSASSLNFLFYLFNESGDLSQLGIDPAKHYKIKLVGHVDCGASGDYNSGVTGLDSAVYMSSAAHFSLYTPLSSGATTPLTAAPYQNGILQGMWGHKVTAPVKSALQEFTIWGTRYTNAQERCNYTADPNLNTTLEASGAFLSSFSKAAFFCEFNTYSTANSVPEVHASVAITISEVLDLRNARNPSETIQ